MGARRFGIAAVGPLGCIPFELTYSLAVNGTCDKTVNTQIQSFNVGLEALVNQLSSQLSGAQFTFLDAYTIVDTIIQNPSDYGKFLNPNPKY
jgi:phospholipase/lecithinase/hemolysin